MFLNDQPRIERLDGVETVTICGDQTGSAVQQATQSQGGPTANLGAAFAGHTELHELVS